MIKIPGKSLINCVYSSGFSILFSVIFLLSGTTSFAYARDCSFSWSANLESVAGYKLYYKKGGSAGPPFDGTDSPKGSSPIDVGNETTFTITGLEGDTTYHFSLTAYDDSAESDFSQVVTVYGQVSSPVSSIISILLLKSK